jgi:uncharacterized membrane protein
MLAIGIFFRFANLDTKVYGYDETYTSLRVSGYTRPELLAAIASNEILMLGDLQKYQHVAPEKSESGVIQGLAEEEPQHPPSISIGKTLGAVLGRFSDSNQKPICPD